MYNAIRNKNRILAVPLVSKHTAISYVPSGHVYSNKLGIFTFETFDYFCVLQSTMHNIWGWKFASTLGAGTLNYSNTICFETFPFPQNLSSEMEQKLDYRGEVLYEHRRQLMLKMQLGLTKTYNAFHAKEITVANLTSSADMSALADKKAIQKQYGKEVWNLWNHLQKTEGTCALEESVAGIEELRRLHVEMDNAVLEAYSWNTDSEKWDKAIKLAHDFYEVNYLPENDRVRFTISPAVRKEVLKRLLLLNHERYEEELHQGLHKNEDAEKFYQEKGQPMPAEVAKHYSKKYEKPKGKKQILEEPGKGYGQGKLF